MGSAQSLFISLASLVVLVTMLLCASWIFMNRRLVRAHSPILAAGRRLNAEFAGRIVRLPKIKYSFTTQVRSKASFDRSDVMAVYYQCLLEREYEISAVLTQHRRVADSHVEYMRLFDELAARKSEPPTTRLPPDRFASIERKLLRRSAIRQPPSRALVECHVSYQSPKGQNSYSKSVWNDFAQFVANFEQVRAIAARQTTAQRQRARERALMSSSLRYEILRRDGHRCKSCGASSASGATLHVDHIFPVSKGGRTTSANLQTLCEPCNLGKRDRV